MLLCKQAKHMSCSRPIHTAPGDRTPATYAPIYLRKYSAFTTQPAASSKSPRGRSPAKGAKTKGANCPRASYYRSILHHGTHQHHIVHRLLVSSHSRHPTYPISRETQYRRTPRWWLHGCTLTTPILVVYAHSSLHIWYCRRCCGIWATNNSSAASTSGAVTFAAFGGTCVGCSLIPSSWRALLGTRMLCGSTE